MPMNMFTGPSNTRGVDKMGQGIDEIKVHLLRVRKKLGVEYMKGLFIIASHMDTACGDFILFKNALNLTNNIVETWQFAAM